MRERPEPPSPPTSDEPLAEPRFVGVMSYFGGWSSRLGFYGIIFTAVLGIQYLATQDPAFRASTSFLGGVTLFLFLLAFALNLVAHVGRRTSAKDATPDAKP